MNAKVLSDKLDLIQWLSTVEDERIIKRLLDFKKKETQDWGEQISEDVKTSIQKGEKQANRKELKPHSEAKKTYAKWL